MMETSSSNKDKKYSLLTKSEFFEIFKIPLNLKENEFYFITKAYYEKDNIIAVFKEELEKDCYFQLPEYSTKLVPNERRFIYLLPKNKGIECSKSKSPDGRYNIDISNLLIVADPYNSEKKIEEKSFNTQENNVNLYAQIKSLSGKELIALMSIIANELLIRTTKA